MSEETTANLPEASLLIEKIEELKEKLQNAAPGYEGLLYTIHKQLAADEQLVHILTEDQIGIIVAGLSKKKNIIIASAVSAKTTKASLKNVSLGDLE